MDPLTQHAATRMQQRGIDASTLDALLTYGAGAHDGRGAVVWYFDGDAIVAAM